MENAGIIDEESGEERYDEVDHVKSAHFESGVKGYNQSCVDPGHRNGVTRSDEASGSEEAEDGEILEDGEIDDEDEEGGVDQGETIQEDAEIAHGELEQQTNTHVVEKSDVEANQDQVDAQKEDSESEKEEEEASKEKRKKDKRRRKRQREKEKKKKIKDDSKRKRKRHDYVDYDNVEAEFDHQSKVRRHSPLRPYNSPYQSPDERGKRSPPGPYESPYRSPPGPYDSPPESPPGPYDSPPEDSDEDERYGDQNNIRKRPKKSMMGLLDDPFLDPNIAAAEKQGIYGRPRGGRNRRGKSQQPRKKPLLETPREARPLCKFYKEGKCAKGSQCPFNHDFKPPKKPDICKFYLNNTCNKGSDCIYMHGEYPCKFFHTGAECFGGEDCKFSHEPLTAETYQLLNKILDNDLEFDAPPKNPRPSLLGSPPRHVKEAAERMKGIDPSKKIPSLLDIEVFPPKQSPQKKQNSPNKEILSPKAGQAANRPGFYTETAPAQPGYNPAVAALGALLNKATASSSPRYYQSPGSQGGFGSGDCMTDGQADSHETEDSEVDPNSQDTQKLDDDESQDDGGLRGEEMPYEEDRKVTSFEVPSHLPPKQRELFMRIHNQQQAEGGLPDENKEDEVEKDDDDWYSSDEDDGQPKQKIMDMLKNISKQPPTARPPTQSVPEVKEQPKPTDSGSGASSFNILQMLNAIRGQSSAASITSPGSVSSASQLIGSLLPQSVKTSAKEIPLDNSQSLPAVEHSPPPVDDTPDPMLALLPKVPKDGSELPYKVLPITVSKTSYIPSNLNLNDPRVSSDPRVQRYISKVGPQKLERQSSGGSSQPKVERQNSRKSEKESVSVSSSAKVADPRRSSSTTVEVNAASKPADPRKARMAAASEGPSDPRRAQKDSTANSNEDPLKSNSDARLQRAMTELIQSAVNIPDPRLQKSQSNPVLGMHSMPVRPPMPPGFPPMGFPSGPPGGPMRPIGAGPPRPMGAGPPRPGMPRPRNVRPPLLQTPIMPDNSFRPRGPPPFMDPRFGRQNSNDLSYGSSTADPRSRPGMSPGHEHPAGFGQASGDPRDPRNRSAGVSPSHGQDPLASGTVDPRDPRNRSPGTSHSQEQLGNAAANDSRDPRMRSAGISPSHSQELPGPPAIDPRGDPRDPRNRQAGKSPSQDHSPGALLMDPRVRQVKSQDNLDPRIKSQGFNNSKKSDPRMDRQGGSLDSGLTGRSISDPRMSRQTSQPVMSSGDSRGDRSDDNVSPRLDPRSFRKTEVDTEKKSHSPRIRKRFIGERKGSMEYSSPLGLGSDQPDPAVTGFSTYNRLPGVRGGLKQRINDQPVDSQPSSDPRSQKLSGYKNSPVYNSGYDSPQEQRENEDVEQIELTAGLQAPPLKELFKTIDPTASPFC